MKWKVEYITTESSNILVDDPRINQFDQDVVGMGFPVKLAERIVSMHNGSIENLEDQLLESIKGKDF